MSVVVLCGGMLATPGSARQPFAFLSPAISIEPVDQTALDGGEALVKLLPARERDLAVFGAVRLDAPADRLVAWTRRIELLQANRYIPAIARFSSPPRIEDLAALTLGDQDLESIRRCRPGHCDVKLSAAEIARLQEAIRGSASWKSDLQTAFRGLVLARVQAYLADGDGSTQPYDDESRPVSAGTEFAALVERAGFLTLRVPDLTEFLQVYPRMDHPRVSDSFLYWSVAAHGGLKAIASVTHVSIVRNSEPDLPETMAVSKQVFATHYMTASLAVTAVTHAREGDARYLLYLNRSRVDVLDGVFGGLVRRMIERRIRHEAPDALQALRRRLEAGDPP